MQPLSPAKARLDDMKGGASRIISLGEVLRAFEELPLSESSSSSSIVHVSKDMDDEDDEDDRRRRERRRRHGRRNGRRDRRTRDGDDGDGDGGITHTPAVPAAPLAARGGALSFADEEAEEGEATWITRKPGRMAPSALPTAAAMPMSHFARPGEYTAERMRQLREGGFLLRPSPRCAPRADRSRVLTRPCTPPASRMNASVLSDVAIKGSVKAETPNLGRPQGAPDPSCLDEALDAEGPSGEAIPSAEAIRAAKRDRQQRRAVHAATGYIPLTSNRFEAAPQPMAVDEPVAFNAPPPDPLMEAARGMALDPFPPASDADADADAPEMFHARPPPTTFAQDSGALSIASASSHALALLSRDLDAHRRDAQHRAEEVERVEARAHDADTAAAAASSSLASTSSSFEAAQATSAYLAQLCGCLREKAPIIEELNDRLEAAVRRGAEVRRKSMADTEATALAACQAAVAHSLARQFAAAGRKGGEGRGEGGGGGGGVGGGGRMFIRLRICSGTLIEK